MNSSRHEVIKFGEVITREEFKSGNLAVNTPTQRRSAWMRDDPASLSALRRDSDSPGLSPLRIRPEHARLAALESSSAPVFRLGSCALARGRNPLEFGFYQIAEGSVLFAGDSL